MKIYHFTHSGPGYHRILARQAAPKLFQRENEPSAVLDRKSLASYIKRVIHNPSPDSLRELTSEDLIVAELNWSDKSHGSTSLSKSLLRVLSECDKGKVARILFYCGTMEVFEELLSLVHSEEFPFSSLNCVIYPKSPEEHDCLSSILTKNSFSGIKCVSNFTEALYTSLESGPIDLSSTFCSLLEILVATSSLRKLKVNRIDGLSDVEHSGDLTPIAIEALLGSEDDNRKKRASTLSSTSVSILSRSPVSAPRELHEDPSAFYLPTAAIAADTGIGSGSGAGAAASNSDEELKLSDSSISRSTL